MEENDHFYERSEKKKKIYFKKWNLEEIDMKNHSGSTVWLGISSNTKESFF